MSEYYGLDGQPITMEEWSKVWQQKRARAAQADGWTTPEEDSTRIGYDTVGKAHVSTVWLGLDHSFGLGPPIIFETMVFGGEYDQYCTRYSTKEQARAGHKRVVADLRAGRDPFAGEDL